MSTTFRPDWSESTLAGRTLPNGLRVLENLGSTREGPLYRAQLPSGLEIALVILGSDNGGRELSVDPGPLAYQQQRFRQVAQIRHVNVAAVHEMGEIPDGPDYVVLEYLTGKPLSQILAERGAFPPDEAMYLVLQAAAGLEAAHKVGLVHANLAPDTILVTQTPDGPLVKLIGFALVSSLRPAREKPLDREAGVEYASPERLAGYVPDERSDVFSLGAVLHHLLVGSPPSFGSEGLVPEVMRALVAKTLHPIPERRFQTMSEFVGAVKHAAAVATGSKRRRTRRALLLTAAGIIPLVAAGVWLFASLQGRGRDADGLAQEGGTTDPATGVPAEGTETGSALLAGGAEEYREAPADTTVTVRQEKLASLGAAAAGATAAGATAAGAAAERLEKRRRDRAEAAERALNGDEQIQPSQPSSVSEGGPAERDSAPDTSAMSPPSPASAGLTLDERALPSLGPAAAGAAAAGATAERVEKRRRDRAETAERALNGEEQIQPSQPSSVSEGGPAGRDSAPDTSAMSPPSPASAGLTLEERAQVDPRIGLDEAARQLGEPAHAIEGMSPLFMGLARGRFPEGADTTVPLVRGVYLDPNGNLILLDQQRIRSKTRAPATTGTRWPIGDVMLYLHGESRPAMLRNLARRVR